MTNNGSLQRAITIQGQKLETVDYFKHLGAIICDEGSRRQVLSRAAQTMAALARITPILERQEHQNKTQNKTNARPGHNNIPLCVRDLDTHSRTTEENPVARVYMLMEDLRLLLQRPNH